MPVVRPLRPTRLAVLALGALVAVAGTAPVGATQEPGNSFADAPVGAAAGVTGGGDGGVRVVTKLSDEGAGSLRHAAEEDGPAVIVFAVSGEIELEQAIEVGSDLTIDGRGADITLIGKGLVISDVENVIVRNIRVHGDDRSDSNDDAIGVLGGSSGVWIDHVSVTGFEDGLIDVVQEATDVTISWSHLHDHDKAMLLGANVRDGTPPLVDVTVHHNLFERTSERSPLVRQGHVQVVNNVIEAWGYDADSGYAVRSDCGSQVLVEANVFLPAENDRAAHDRAPGCDEARPPSLALRDNVLNGAVAGEARPQAVEISEATRIRAEPAGDALVSSVRAGAGWQDVPNPLPIEVPEENGGDDAAAPSGEAAGDTRSPDDDSGRSGTGPLGVVAVGLGGLVIGIVAGRRSTASR